MRVPLPLHCASALLCSSLQGVSEAGGSADVTSTAGVAVAVVPPPPTSATEGGSLADGGAGGLPQLQSFLICSASTRHLAPAEVDRLLDLPQKGATAATAAKLVAQASMRQLSLAPPPQQQ